MKRPLVGRLNQIDRAGVDDRSQQSLERTYKGPVPEASSEVEKLPSVGAEFRVPGDREESIRLPILLFRSGFASLPV